MVTGERSSVPESFTPPIRPVHTADQEMRTAMHVTRESWSPGITSMIRLDHSHVLALFRRFKPTTSAGKKQALIDSTCLALQIHAQLEEEIFYPALRQALGAEEVLDKSVPEHDEMRRLIAQLQLLRPGSDQDEAFRCLIRTVLHHVADEETVLLPQAEEVLAAQLKDLGQQMTRRRMQLLWPHAGKAAVSTVRSFPVASAVVMLGTLAIAWSLVSSLIGPRNRSSI
jgi:hemerythrin superfamily protein